MKKTVVTIARSYGSGGKEIGKGLAEALGVKYYGREILEMLRGKETYEVDDESIQDTSLEEASKLFEEQSRIIREIAEKESCVIVGRCADYVLKDEPYAVKVYLYAPLKNCMKRVSRLYQLNPDDAKELIRSMNKTRGNYYEHNTGRNWADLTHYDISINTAGMSTEQCIEVIKKYIENKMN